jgi:hypothetical protein
MVSARNHPVIWGLFLLVISHVSSVSAQTRTGTLPPVVIKDKIVESVLSEYTQVAGANEGIIAVFLERYDNDYTYTLYDFGLYDQIMDNPTADFGRWKNHTLLFYTGLKEIAASMDTDTAKVNQIRRYIRMRLPDGNVSKPDPSNPNLVEMITTTHHPKIWRFKVRDGKLLWLRRGLGYQSEKVPYMK